MESALRKIVALERAGSVKEALSRFNPKVAENEGANDYITKTIDSPTSHTYLGKTTEIRIPLTDVNVDVADFTKSFFSLKCVIEVYFPNGPLFFNSISEHVPEWAEALGDSSYSNWWEDPKLIALAKAHYIFIGFKSAGDVIHQYKITHNGTAFVTR
jgi:hypothetical protein